jgi:hypothetical protein
LTGGNVVAVLRPRQGWRKEGMRRGFHPWRKKKVRGYRDLLEKV